MPTHVVRRVALAFCIPVILLFAVAAGIQIYSTQNDDLRIGTVSSSSVEALEGASPEEATLVVASGGDTYRVSTDAESVPETDAVVVLERSGDDWELSNRSMVQFPLTLGLLPTAILALILGELAAFVVGVRSRKKIQSSDDSSPQ